LSLSVAILFAFVVRLFYNALNVVIVAVCCLVLLVLTYISRAILRSSSWLHLDVYLHSSSASCLLSNVISLSLELNTP